MAFRPLRILLSRFVLGRIEKLSSALRDVRKRVDKKADASATERVLAEKVDEVNKSRCRLMVDECVMP